MIYIPQSCAKLSRMPTTDPDSRTSQTAPHSPWVAGGWVLSWLIFFGTIQWSVVRFEYRIVAVLTLAALGLGATAIRRWPSPAIPSWQLSAALVAVAGLTLWLPFFSHTSASDHRILADVMAGTALLAALMVWRRPQIAVAITAVGLIGWTALAIRFSPSPRIDVWVTLQQAADGLIRGDNPYTMNWQDSPGVTDAFTYLPGTLLFLGPGRWLAGDVRWALLVVLLLGLGFMLFLEYGKNPSTSRTKFSPYAITGVLLLALAPGSITQAEQAWTEPLLFAALAGWALAMSRAKTGWAILALACACASKQHIALLMPLLACWPRFGVRRTFASGTLAAGIIAPMALANPAAFWRDTVTFLAQFHPIQFANTWYLAALHRWDFTPPGWLPAIILLSVIAGACYYIHRRNPSLSELLGWLAFALLMASLVNKQAFYNQFWLVGALIALAMAATVNPGSLAHPQESEPTELPDHPTAIAAPPTPGPALHTAQPALDPAVAE